MRLFIEYSYERSFSFFNSTRQELKPSQETGLIPYKTYSARKNELKLFAEYGFVFDSTFLFTLEGGFQEGFNFSYHNDWVSTQIGIRLSKKLKNITTSLEGAYGYNQFSEGQAFLRARGDSFASLSVEFGKDWVFIDAINLYITAKTTWQKNWRAHQEDEASVNAVLGIKLLEDAFGNKVIFLNQFLFKTSLENKPNMRAEEFKIEFSLVVFPFSGYGLEIGYRETVLGKNINRGRGYFTKLWFEF